MKRSISLVLCLVMLFSIFSVCGVVAGAADANDAMYIKSNGFVNDRITYTVYLKKNVSLAGAVVWFGYDNTVLEPVSGGAVGTDTYAHSGALKADCKTVLVMGCGILHDYLPENKKLREENDELKEKIRVYEEWLDRMQEFCNLPEEERINAVRQYQSKIKTNEVLEEITKKFYGYFDIMYNF